MSIIAGFAPAKLNLSLRVMARRPDGFHELDSVVAFVDLCDSLMFSYPRDGAQHLHVTGRAASIPVDQNNLVLKAAEVLAEHVDRNLPFHAVLDKRIPSGAGLGGGSSDAATTLLALNEMHGLDLEPHELAAIGARVGSDVAMFVTGGYGSCRITGRGEIVEPLDWVPPGYCFLILPPIHTPTPAVYCAWDAEPTTTAPADGRNGLPDDSGSAAAWLEKCFNDLEPAAMRLFPRLAQIREQAQHICGRRVCLTGSGSTLFTAFDTRGQAERAAELIADELTLETLVAVFRTSKGSSLPEVQHADH